MLASPLSHIFNLSFSSGVFPDALKIGKVLPIFKNDDSSLFSNYRPISILPCLSKVLEKLFYSRLFDFLIKFNVLNHHQYGFRQHHSTYMAILELVNNIYQGFENNEYTIGIFVDLKKAFDTVNHNILLDKLNFYGIRGTPLAWLASYLSNRQQYVQVHDHASSYMKIKCGVPQGSVLGPLLFLIYINDLFHSSKYLSFILFADDTSIFYRHKDIQTLINTVNSELCLVSSWFKANKLTLHPDKTKFILFHPSRKKVNLDEIHISINGAPLSRVDNTKFLGVIIHQNPLFLLQKKAIRIITFSPPQTHTKPLFHKLNILPIHSIFKCQVACFVFSHMNNLLPASFSSSFHFNFEYHDHFTRSRLNLHKVFAKYHLSICSQAPSIWNSLPLTFRNSLNISNYRSNIKKHFLNN